jgi:hypothetical protein
MWTRLEGAFEPIVDADFFFAACRIIEERSKTLTDAEMLDQLSSLLNKKGILSGLIIDEFDNMPSSSTYRYRFGSLLRAYQLVGYDPRRDYRYVEINRALRDMFPEIVASTISSIKNVGGHVQVDSKATLLSINDEFTVSIVLVRCLRSGAGFLRWKIRLDAGLRPDITIAVRMDEANENILDYYLLPRIDISEERIRLAQDNGVHLDAYRFESLDHLFELCSRKPFRSAA